MFCKTPSIVCVCVCAHMHIGGGSMFKLGGGKGGLLDVSIRPQCARGIEAKTHTHTAAAAAGFHILRGSGPGNFHFLYSLKLV